MKKIISILLTLVLALERFPVSAFAAGNEETCAVAPYSSNAYRVMTSVLSYSTDESIRQDVKENISKYFKKNCLEDTRILDRKGTL